MSSQSEEEGYSPEASNQCEEPQNGADYHKRVENEQKASVQGKWTLDENIRYALFMDFHSAVFSSKQRRKSTRIFKSLAAFLETRTPRQCRSHFQKIMNKFNKLNKVRHHFEQLIGTVQYQHRYELLADKLKDSVILNQVEEGPIDIGIQTDPLQIQLSDLSNFEVLKLMNMLNQCYRCQIPMPENVIKMQENGPNLIQFGLLP